MDTKFLPQPKQLTFDQGTLTFTPHTRIVVPPSVAPQALLYAQMLQQAICTHAGLCPALGRGESQTGDITLSIDTAQTVGHYTLSVCTTGISLVAADDEALCNAVQTLIQLVQQHGAMVPCLHIADFPNLAHRGYYQDCSRGRVPTLGYLKRVADLLCRYKINEWQLYIEHTYLFRNLSEAWRDDTPLTADDILELDAYCAARHIELVPSLSSFGHMYKILSTKTCCDLCELPDSEKIPFSYTYAGSHHTLNVSNPNVVDFIKSLIDEYRPLFRSKKFNICADETFDLGKGRSKELADQLGEKALYVQHVKALCEYLVEQGCTPMFWGDIMWRFPQSCAELPKETICLNWGYLPNQRENEIRDIAASGITQYACPGVCGWNRWFPLYHNAYSNIRAMCHHAHKYNAIGLLNTDWGDYAHINDPRLTIPGILYGAAFGWNAQPIEFDELNRTVSRIGYGDTSEQLMGSLADLADHEIFDWQHAVNWIEGDSNRRAELLAELDFSLVEQANAAIRSALDRVLACSSTLPAGEKEIISIASITAESVLLWNEIGCWINGEQAPNFELAERLEHWYALYLQQWRQVSREGGLHHLTALIASYADLLRGRHIA